LKLFQECGMGGNESGGRSDCKNDIFDAL
jgi:hypothetical protein